MRLPRRPPVLLLALCLLTSAATAYAECAWVLWDGQISNVPGRDMLWSIQGTYLTTKDCTAGLARLVAVKKQGGDDATEPQAGTALYRRGETRGYLHCLPDTLDPRGPKGK